MDKSEKFINIKKILIISMSLMMLSASSVAKTDNQNLSSKVLRSMARVQMAYGQYDKALPLAEKALITATNENAPDRELAMCYIDLAVVYKGQNKLLQAKQSCQKGLDIQKKNMYEKHPYLAYTMRILSSISFEQGDYTQARSVLDQAINIMFDAHTENDSVMAPFFVDVAKICIAQGDLLQAENFYQKAMILINSSYGPDHLYTANVLAGLAKLYTLQKKYYQAEQLIDQVASIQQKFYGQNHHLVAASQMLKAEIYQAKGQLTVADKLIDEALAMVKKSGNASEFSKLQQTAKDIRLGKLISYAR